MEEPDKGGETHGNRDGAVVVDARSPKSPWPGDGEDDAVVEVADEDGAPERAQLEVVPLVDGEKRSDRVFVGAGPVAPPFWDWIHLRERPQHLPRAISLPLTYPIDFHAGEFLGERIPRSTHGHGQSAVPPPQRLWTSCLTIKIRLFERN